ncbi:hypothetical protein CEV33_2936 [Brucella grignonensis]|uniref:Uncharacterized protein n=1 Tax=Brucella grignonensis TaxID=94627 RepID=A0A256F2Y5_9HYPH|nr:hypothetical protein CEV33_2936 [Brucella grignonensis]
MPLFILAFITGLVSTMDNRVAYDANKVNEINGSLPIKSAKT